MTTVKRTNDVEMGSLIKDPKEDNNINAEDDRKEDISSKFNMTAVSACALYSSCSVSMVLVNKSLASR